MRVMLNLILALALAGLGIGPAQAGRIFKADQQTVLKGAAPNVTVASSGGTSTWNPSDKDSGITLSNGNLTATGPGSVSYKGVRSNLGMAADSGKYCWEFNVDSYSVEADFGVANATFATNADGRTDANATVIDDGGNIYYTNNYGTYIGSNLHTVGTKVMVCIDTASGVRKAWFAKDTVFDGNPAAGTGGYALPSGTVYILYVTRHTDGTTLNAAPSGKPTGFGNAP